jgi:hypothetical protein
VDPIRRDASQIDPLLFQQMQMAKSLASAATFAKLPACTCSPKPSHQIAKLTRQKQRHQRLIVRGLSKPGHQRSWRRAHAPHHLIGYRIDRTKALLVKLLG